MGNRASKDTRRLHDPRLERRLFIARAALVLTFMFLAGSLLWLLLAILNRGAP